MSRDLMMLEPQTRARVKEVLHLAEREGEQILVYQTFRSPQWQAKLWRQSRTTVEITEKIQAFRDRDLDFLADIIENTPPQFGKLGQHVTFAGPGESWHNYHRAIDAVPVIDGKCVWEPDNELWGLYGWLLERAGLHWGGEWTRFPDLPHGQLQKPGNPLKHFDPDFIARCAVQYNWRPLPGCKLK